MGEDHRAEDSGKRKPQNQARFDLEGCREIIDNRSSGASRLFIGSIPYNRAERKGKRGDECSYRT